MTNVNMSFKQLDKLERDLCRYVRFLENNGYNIHHDVTQAIRWVRVDRDKAKIREILSSSLEINQEE